MRGAVRLQRNQGEWPLLRPQAMVAPWRWGLPVPTWSSIWSEIVRLVKYQMVGFSNSLVSLAVLNLFFLAWAPTTQLVLVLGSTVAYAAGDINSYWWNKSWTFRAGRASWKQFARFAALSIAGITINALVLWASSGWLLALYLPPWLLGNIPQISMALTGSLGYLACRFWVFKPHQR